MVRPSEKKRIVSKDDASQSTSSMLFVCFCRFNEEWSVTSGKKHSGSSPRRTLTPVIRLLTLGHRAKRRIHTHHACAPPWCENAPLRPPVVLTFLSLWWEKTCCYLVSRRQRLTMSTFPFKIWRWNYVADVKILIRRVTFVATWWPHVGSLLLHKQHIQEMISQEQRQQLTNIFQPFAVTQFLTI